MAELLGKLRLDFIFVGDIARSAWLGGTVDAGAVDVLAVMGPQQKNQVAMMAANRGFGVDRDAIEAAEELDLIPLDFLDAEGDVRVHVLVASNALYAHMVARATAAQFEGRDLRVSSAEALALMLTVAGDEEAVQRLVTMEGFDKASYNATLRSIGLGAMEV